MWVVLASDEGVISAKNSCHHCWAVGCCEHQISLYYNIFKQYYYNRYKNDCSKDVFNILF